MVGTFHGTFTHKIKAKPRLATSKSPKPAGIKGKTRTVVSIAVKVAGMDPKGWAAVKIGGKQYKGKLVDGQVKDQAAEVQPRRQAGARSSTWATTTSDAPSSSSTCRSWKMTSVRSFRPEGFHVGGAWGPLRSVLSIGQRSPRGGHPQDR